MKDVLERVVCTAWSQGNTLSKGFRRDVDISRYISEVIDDKDIVTKAD